MPNQNQNNQNQNPNRKPEDESRERKPGSEAQRDDKKRPQERE